MKRKRGNNEILKNLPLDCWSHIILFFHDYNDLLSLSLTIKGLHHHVLGLLPGSTSNVLFRMYSLVPYSQRVNHIHNVYVGNWPGVDSTKTFLNNFGSEDLSKLFKEITTILTSLKTLGFFVPIVSSSMIPSESWNPSSLVIEETVFLLRVMKIHISSCDLTLSTKSNFPNVEYLELCRLSFLVGASEGGGNVYMRDDMVYNQFPRRFDNPSDLSVSWNSFPKLRKLYLLGWNLTDSLHDLSERNDLDLTINHCILQEDNFSGISKLKKLSLSAHTSAIVEKIEELESIEELNISSDHFIPQRDGECSEKEDRISVIRNRGFRSHMYSIHCMLHQNFQIELPNLRILRFDRMVSVDLPNQTLLIKNLQCLEELSVVGLEHDPDCRLEGTPNLKRIYLEDIRNFTVANESDVLSLQEIEFSAFILFSSVSDVLDHLSKFKELKSFIWKDRTLFSKLENHHVSFVSFPSLKILKLDESEIYVKEVRNCTQIEIMRLSPTCDFKLILDEKPGLPIHPNRRKAWSSLREIVLDFFDNDNETTTDTTQSRKKSKSFQNAMKQIRDNVPYLSVLKTLKIRWSGYGDWIDPLKLSIDNDSFPQSLQLLEIYDIQKMELNGKENDVEHTSVIPKLVIYGLEDYRFLIRNFCVSTVICEPSSWKGKFDIHDCSETTHFIFLLFEGATSSSSSNSNSSKKNTNITIMNCTNLKRLDLVGSDYSYREYHFSEAFNLTIENSPICVLTIDTNIRNMEISEKNFPQLETINIITPRSEEEEKGWFNGKKNDNTNLHNSFEEGKVIKLISRVRSLVWIRCSKKCFLKTSFVERVEGVDTVNDVKVSVVGKIMSFQEYIEMVKDEDEDVHPVESTE